MKEVADKGSREAEKGGKGYESPTRCSPAASFRCSYSPRQKNRVTHKEKLEKIAGRAFEGRKC